MQGTVNNEFKNNNLEFTSPVYVFSPGFSDGLFVRIRGMIIVYSALVFLACIGRML